MVTEAPKAVNSIIEASHGGIAPWVYARSLCYNAPSADCI